MRANMISAEVVHRENRGEIDSLCDFLTSFDFQGWLRVGRCHGRNLLTFASGHFKSVPRLSIGVMKIDIAPSKVRDAENRHHRFVGDVLQSLQFQLHLNLRLSSSCKQAKKAKGSVRLITR